MITEYRDPGAAKKPGKWYTYTYENGLRVTFAEYQGPVSELEAFGKQLSMTKGREIRMRVHDKKSDRIHAIFCLGKKTTL